MSTDSYELRPTDTVQAGDEYINSKGKTLPVPKQLVGHKPPKGMTIYRETRAAAAPTITPLTTEQQRHAKMAQNLMLGALRDLKVNQ